MASYLLLRNNKESGPYSVDDLMQLGLKPYDLLWVSGKSAAWRYPSEIDELKGIAPVVEEQPYDRFYKKAEETAAEPLSIAEPITPASEISPEPVVAKEHEAYLPKRSVHVSMPGQKSGNVTQQNSKQAQPAPVGRNEPTLKPSPERSQQLSPHQQYQPPVSPVAEEKPTISVSENPVAAQVKYSQPLDEIKEMYVKTLHERKQKIARRSFWVDSLKKVAVLVSLVAVGLIAGFIIKSDKKTAGSISQVQGDQLSITEPSESDAEAGNVDEPMNIKSSRKSTPLVDVDDSRVFSNEREPGIARSKTSVQKEPDTKAVADQPLDETQVERDNVGLTEEHRNISADPATGERNRKVRNGHTGKEEQMARETESSKSNSDASYGSHELSGLVRVETNNYKKVAFGGIRDLHLTVTNESKYTLDNVIVELQYLKPSEQSLRTENIQFKSIEPKSSSTIRIPDTNRGIKIVYKIIHVKSRQLDEGVAGN